MGKLTDKRRAEILGKLALRSQLGDSGVIPLTGPPSSRHPEGEDIGDEFWVVFKEANAEELSSLESRFIRELVRNEADDDGKIEMVTERRYDTFGMLRAVVEDGLIKDAVFPKLNEKGEIEVLKWPRKSYEQKQLLVQIMPGLQGILFKMINDFYFGEDQVEVEDEEGNAAITSDQDAVVSELKN